MGLETLDSLEGYLLDSIKVAPGERISLSALVTMPHGLDPDREQLSFLVFLFARLGLLALVRRLTTSSDETCHDRADAHTAEDSSDPRLSADRQVGAYAQERDTHQEGEDLTPSSLAKLPAHGLNIRVRQFGVNPATMVTFFLRHSNHAIRRARADLFVLGEDGGQRYRAGEARGKNALLFTATRLERVLRS